MRSCGECGVCCTTHDVPSLRKPPGTACKHVCGGGCGIYGARPGECRAFECGWLSDSDGTFSESERPDRVGVVVSREWGTPLGDILSVIEGSPGSSKTPAAERLIARLARRGLVVVRGERTRFAGPPELVSEARWLLGEGA